MIVTFYLGITVLPARRICADNYRNIRSNYIKFVVGEYE